MNVVDPDAKVPYTRVACIGAGISGICLAAQLKRQLGFTDLRLFERNRSVGGTWLVNTYPGAACDVPASLYSYSFELNPNWSCLMPSHSEILAYLEAVARKYDVPSRTRFNCECELAKWDETRKIWRLLLRDVQTGEKFEHECSILFSAVGILDQPNDCTIPGVERFQGAIFHSARWNHDVDLTGKDVAILGNGCSAAQIVPNIIPITRSTTQFIRTAQWVHARVKLPFGPKSQWAFRNIPLAMRIHRFLVFAGWESEFRLFYMTPAGQKFRATKEERYARYMKRKAPEKYHDILIPSYPFGCKRRVVDSHGYMASLNDPKMNITSSPIQEILPRGIRTVSGEYPADVIVLATGFKTNQGLYPLQIRGRDGVELSDHWTKFGGPEAYMTTAMNGFPNFFMLVGPNSATGHTSLIMTTENMVNYAIRVTKPILAGNAVQVEVKAASERRYSDELQGALKERVWNASCNSWYTSKNGWNSTIYPWTQIWFWWSSLFPRWSDWQYTRGDSKRSSRSFLALILGLVSLSVALAWRIAKIPLGLSHSITGHSDPPK